MNFCIYSSNKNQSNIDMKFVTANPDKPWNWAGLSSNPNVDMKIVTDNPDKPWDWAGLSSNPNIDMKFVTANPDKPWNWLGLSCNNFKYDSYLQRVYLNKLKRLKGTNNLYSLL